MKNENDFADFKYKLFKKGAPEPKYLATQYAQFRDSGANENVTKTINDELYNLMKMNPKEEAFIFRLLSEEIQEQIDPLRVELNNQKEKEISRILITSGYLFEGYRIVKYSGYISGDDATLVKKHVAAHVYNGTDTVGTLVTAVANSERYKEDQESFETFAQNTTDAFAKIRKQAIKELKEAAYDLDCNAVIGVDFDYVTLDT